ncbi:MAG TPA: LamG-like jellyroll fold domain-containing protein [Phycisphaerales bacterium]|nr:LamG-like jellyroll fold domain-containing protein [Phycisphaerales bacterium]
MSSAKFLSAVLALASCAASSRAQIAYFDQPTDTIRLTGNTVLGSTHTIEAYVFPTIQTPGQTGRIFAEQFDAVEDKWLIANATQTSGGHWNNNCDSGRAVSGPLTLFQWHHIAYVRSGNTYNFFIDGVRVDQRAATCAGGNANSSVMTIGAFRYQFANLLHESFIGYIDWVRVSSTARYPLGGFSAPSLEPLSDADTLILMTFNDLPGTTNPAVQGSAVFGAAVAAGFAGATSPDFGPGPCDSIDFNRNGVFPEDQDVTDFFTALAGDSCSTCADIDFNNNGVYPEDQDIIDFFTVLAGGACP